MSEIGPQKGIRDTDEKEYRFGNWQLEDYDPCWILNVITDRKYRSIDG